MINPQIYPNGLKTLIFPLKGTKAVTVLILVKTGSRCEKPEERGISHFLEHLFFKGGKKYKNSREVAKAIDKVGGDFNAFTAKEYTGFYVKLAKEHVDIAFDVLSDMLLTARFDEAEIEKERGVILEEYNLYQDTPIYQIGWDFENLLFGNQPMGWDQIGTKETIKSLKRANFVDYKKSFYIAENTNVIITGNISEKDAQDKIKKYFSFDKTKNTRSYEKFIWPASPQKISIKNKKTEQGHLVIGYPGVPFGSDEEFTARILSIILGGNMSSRMFAHVRDELGLCYSIRTSTDHFSDVGVFSTHAGVDLLRFEEAVKAIKNEYDKIKEEGVEEEELENAKNFLKGKIILSIEDSEQMASFLGTQITLIGKAKTAQEIFKKIEKITKEEVDSLAKELFNPDKIALAAIGPFENMEDSLDKILK